MNQEECVFCQNDLPHGCPNNGVLTDEMIEFGVARKFVQKGKKKKDHVDHKHPYWASTHEYDLDNPDWGKLEVRVTSFVQSGVTHYFGVIPLGIADAICKVPALPKSADSLEICRRTLNNHVTDQYQRPLDFDRLDNINNSSKNKNNTHRKSNTLNEKDRNENNENDADSDRVCG